MYYASTNIKTGRVSKPKYLNLLPIINGGKPFALSVIIWLERLRAEKIRVQIP